LYGLYFVIHMIDLIATKLPLFDALDGFSSNVSRRSIRVVAATAPVHWPAWTNTYGAQ